MNDQTLAPRDRSHERGGAVPETEKKNGVWAHPDAVRQTRAPDMVNSPPHYTAGGIECIEAIRAALTPEEFRGYCKGNAIKYVWRERLKGGKESLEKAAWYLNRAAQ